jgi:hypothetical protein
MKTQTQDFSNQGPYWGDSEIHRQANPPGTCSCEECQPDHEVALTIAFRETDHFDDADDLESAELDSDEVIHFSHLMDHYCDEE